jgi:hypothetical protein
MHRGAGLARGGGGVKKIPTLFKRDPDDMRRVTREVHPDCQWVIDGEGVATRKYDGTCVMYDGERWWARREVKPGKTAPAGFVAIETDDVTGKTVGWEPIEQSAFAKYHAEALAGPYPPFETWRPMTYELCGPKVNGNPESFGIHVLVPHGLAPVDDAPRDFDGLAKTLAEFEDEGIVWHHPDGRMAKLKRRDFPKAATA